ncbi:hypothetical protein [Microbacterium lacticum]|uniref:Uncharacterized protein n=1 Tax=Microbacterium lacticum TaxID=33885 RepID=A0A4Y3UKI3_9MICO|nr:hypothetical protein [Microbacterium lacticum]TQN00731.1 hypothetical protein FHX68_0849 [Microbacterium lacticum]GEB93988.1 hypothetical protein MLA01_02070 [Microbacterium lacticum]GGN13908.1 hypothetical protein GCM10009724_04190 [Microbacterium lacticum]
MTRFNRPTADADFARELRAAGLAQLRGALFYDNEQAAMFSDAETIALAKLHFEQRSGLSAALELNNWLDVSTAALTLHELQQGLQKLDHADMLA